MKFELLSSAFTEVIMQGQFDFYAMPEIFYYDKD